MIEEVIVEFEEYISPIYSYNIITEGGIIDITANNYAVAEYTEGEICKKNIYKLIELKLQTTHCMGQ